MEKGLISKILDYYFDNSNFKDEIFRAMKCFFNRPSLSAGDKLELDEEDEEKFNEWLVFDFCLKNGKNLIENFCQRNFLNLSDSQIQSYEELQKNEYGIFEILKIKIRESLKVKNLRTKKRYWVKERKGTFQTKKGDLLINRIGKIEDHFEFVGSNGYKFLKEAKSFLNPLIIQPNLNPKKVRDFLKEMEKINDAGIDSLKEKILDKGKCVCDVCGKKAKMGALTYKKKTREPVVICYNCNFKITADRDGITTKEAEKKRKRMFEAGYLFQDIKIKEYLNFKNKKDFDLMDEANEILQKIVIVWNDLTTEQRKNFETMEDRKLIEIYKNIPIDFN